MRREYLQVDRLPVDTFVAARYSCRLGFDFVLHLCKVVPFSSWNMVELGPFSLACDTGRCMWKVGSVVAGLVIGRNVDELEDEWSSSDDATASGKKIASNNVF